MTSTLDGVLVVDKPDGLTSHDVVAAIRRVLPRGTRVGHTGTLDPFATGVLPLVVGRATRLSQFLTSSRKQYVAGVAFGAATDTGDRVGVETARADPSVMAALDAGRIAIALDAFVGTHPQVPPAHSAKKVDGERAYARARRGEAVDLAAVEVTAEAVTLEAWEPASHVATVRLDVSAGYYVRSFARDLGERLGVPAHLTSLRRTRSGAFAVHDAITLDDLLAAPDAVPTRVRPMAEALPAVPRLVLDAAQQIAIGHGRTIQVPRSALAVPHEGLVCLLDPHGRLVALATGTPGPASVLDLKPTVVLAPATG